MAVTNFRNTLDYLFHIQPSSNKVKYKKFIYFLLLTSIFSPIHINSFAANIVDSNLLLEFLQQNKLANFNIINRNFIKTYFAPTDQIILTFDDGPHPVYTLNILDILKKHNIKAIFFILGMNAQKYPHIVKKIHDEGHIIGNHTWYHINLKKFSYERIRKEIKDTNEIIKRITGYKPILFRPPYGAYNQNVLEVLKEEDMILLLWSLDPRDWKFTTTKAINALHYQISLSKNGKGGIILLHDTHSSTINLLQEIINTIDYENYSIYGSKFLRTNSNGIIMKDKSKHYLQYTSLSSSSNKSIDLKQKVYWNVMPINIEKSVINNFNYTNSIINILPNKYLAKILQKYYDSSTSLMSPKTIEYLKAFKSNSLYTFLLAQSLN